MLTKFDIKLNCEKDFINYNMGSVFHGALMDLLPREYVDKLHEDTLKPFSQHVKICEDGVLWQICTLNEESQQIVGSAIMNRIDRIELKSKNKELDIVSRTMSSISYKNLIDSTYFDKPCDYFKVYFNSPASFKINGKYIIYPDIESIYKNLMRKFDNFSNEFSLYDNDIIEDLVNNSVISAYKLQSTSYSMESIRIPSYTGWISVKVKNSPQLNNLARLLLKFGEYSGIGIKTALGMGAVRVEEVRKVEKR